MELNAEKIKKALECCGGGWCIRDGCPLYKAEEEDDIGTCTSELAKNALSLITSQEQRIEAYRQDLAEVRVALAEANKERQKLTEENDAWQKQLTSTEEKADKAYYELACEVEKLRTENANLHASYTEFERKCASLNDENERLKARLLAESHLRHQAEEMLAQGMSQVRADTVRKMQERLIAEFRKDDRMNYYIRMTLDQIAKEMLEGEQ